MHKYIKLAPNFHIILNPANRFRTELNLTYSSGGAYFEKDNQKGQTHLGEHCLVTQTKDLNKTELSRLVFEKDIYKNASTGVLTQDMTLSGHKDYVDEMLDLILNFAFEPKFSQDVLDQEKQIVLREIAQKKGDPSYKLWRLVRENIYKLGSKDLCEVSGKEDIVAATTVKDLEKIHQRILKESHFLLSVVGGNVEEEKIIKAAEKYSKNLKSDQTHPIDQNAENLIQDFKYKPIVSELAHDHCVLTLGIPCKINYGNRPIREIFSELFFYFPEGILYKKLREELGLIYSVEHYYDESLQMLRITLVGEIGNVERLVAETVDILTNPEKYIKESEVSIIKNLYVKRQQVASDNPYHPVDFLVNTLMNYGIEQNYDEYLEEIKNLKFKNILDFGKELKDSLTNTKVIAVSKNSEIEKLKLDKFFS